MIVITLLHDNIVNSCVKMSRERLRQKMLDNIIDKGFYVELKPGKIETSGDVVMNMPNGRKTE